MPHLFFSFLPSDPCSLLALLFFLAPPFFRRARTRRPSRKAEPPPLSCRACLLSPARANTAQRRRAARGWQPKWARINRGPVPSIPTSSCAFAAALCFSLALIYRLSSSPLFPLHNNNIHSTRHHQPQTQRETHTLTTIPFHAHLHFPLTDTNPPRAHHTHKKHKKPFRAPPLLPLSPAPLLIRPSLQHCTQICKFAPPPPFFCVLWGSAASCSGNSARFEAATRRRIDARARVAVAAERGRTPSKRRHVLLCGVV